MKWIDLQHKLRVDTSWIIFKPARWVPTTYPILVSGTGQRQMRQYVIPDGHPGALTLMGGVRPLTGGEGEFHGELGKAFAGSKTIPAFIAELLKVVDKWVWKGEAMGSVPIFPKVYYDGRPIMSSEDAQKSEFPEGMEPTSSFITPEAFQQQQVQKYNKMVADIERVKNEVIGG
jgi:hypothetical protein